MADAAKKPVSVRMTEDEIWEYVSNGHTGILITLRRDGYPIGMPIWYAVVDRKIYVNTRGKKLVRIRHDPRSAFLVETGDRWAELRAVHLTGKAEIIEPSAELRAQISAELERKYAPFRTARAAMPEATASAYRNANNGTVCFTPDARILNWDNNKLGLA